MNLPKELIAEINAAAAAGGAITVPARFDDLAPLIARHRELNSRTDLDAGEIEELASLADLLDVARRDGWHTAPRKGNATLADLKSLPDPHPLSVAGLPVTPPLAGRHLQKEAAQ